MSSLLRKPTIRFPNRSDTNQAVQSKEQTIKLEILDVSTICVAKHKDAD